jgi:hypothetical protein
MKDNNLNNWSAASPQSMAFSVVHRLLAWQQTTGSLDQWTTVLELTQHFTISHSQQAEQCGHINVL